MGPNPNGVAPLCAPGDEYETRSCVATGVGRNPFRVVTNYKLDLRAAPSPRVAEYGNPWAERSNPLRGCKRERIRHRDLPEELKMIWK